MKKPENQGLTFWDMCKKVLVSNPTSILSSTTEWTIEFIIDNPQDDLQFIYLSCDISPYYGQEPEPLEDPEQIYIFCHWDSGLDFIKSVAHLRGKVNITPELREKFNLFARDYRWCYLPDMDGYESFFTVEKDFNPSSWSNFADAVFYMVHYLDFAGQVRADAMEHALRTLFVSRDDNPPPMPHQAYPKLALYQDDYYFAWPEERFDFDRMFFLLNHQFR